MTADDLAEHARTNAYGSMTRSAGAMPASMSTSRRVNGERVGDIAVSIPWSPCSGRMTLALPGGHRLGQCLRPAGHPLRVTPPWYRQQIVRQMLRSATTRCPWSGSRHLHRHGAGAAELHGCPFSPPNRPSNVVVVSLTRELVRCWPRSWWRAARCGDGGRDRHHARQRADRCADHALDQSLQVPGVPRLIAGIVTCRSWCDRT